MANPFGAELAPLPLLLWDTPPGLEQALATEGVPFARVREPHPLAFRGGRFVLFDGRKVAESRVRATLDPAHIAVDVDALRLGERVDPFEALIDTRAGPATWRVGGLGLTERVARFPRSAIRHRMIHRLREAINGAGGLWARLAPYPFPYRSAFNFRADLDEPYPEDYRRFARARRPIEDCTTHFVSTHAYGRDDDVLDDLRDLDTQSHGHYHVVYREGEVNRRNVERAHALLVEAGLSPVGFAAPEGRWNAGLDRALQELGYLYSSDFHLGYDDLPFLPWRDGRFSRVLQVPIHPVCEGLFLDAGADASTIAEYLAEVVGAKVASGEPAFVYGHPERRLGRMPEILRAVAGAIEGQSLLWRVTLTEFARWWRWRGDRRWGVVAKADGRFEVQFDDWDPRYPIALEVARGRHVASIPISGARTTLRLEGLAFERRRPRIGLPEPTPAAPDRGLKETLRAALDWETVTPLEELPTGSVTARLKRRLRHWRAGIGERT